MWFLLMEMLYAPHCINMVAYPCSGYSVSGETEELHIYLEFSHCDLNLNSHI